MFEPIKPLDIHNKNINIRGCPGFCVNGFRLNLRHPFFKLDGEAV